MDDFLRIAYYAALAAALLKAVRYFTDYQRKAQWFYLVGIPSNLALGIALGLIAISAGEEPLIDGPWMRMAIRLAFMAWALFSLAFELLYAKTFVIVEWGQFWQNIGFPRR